MAASFILGMAVMCAAPELLLAQADNPPADIPAVNPVEPAGNQVNKPETKPAKKQLNQGANQRMRVPMLNPVNANANQNIIFQQAMANRNALGGMNLGEDRMAQAMSPERLANVQPPPEVLQLLPDLNDPSFKVREAASQKLLEPTISDEAIWAVLDRFTLSDEARSRLLTAAVRRVGERPRGALGIRMDQAPMDRPGVVIRSTLTGLPAEKFLKAGDVIEEIEGVPVLTTMDLVDSIRNFAPGREIKIKLRRPDMDAQGRPLIGPDGKTNDRPVDIVMPLGNAEDLNKAEPGDGQAALNMQLQQRASEGKMILRRFAEPASNSNNALPADTP
ncbi:MAG: PDZ domain-containing protein [Planctomycetota bacterium]|nr:MAG: PDZ domain-containing protein [Planctomycetota bacterium]